MARLATETLNDPASSGALAAVHALDDVRAELGAAHASLVAFESGGRAFRLVASAGLPVFALGVVLPSSASKIAALADGRRESRRGRIGRGDQPADHVLEQLGLRSGVAIPLQRDDACVGAVGFAWTVAGPPLDHAREVARERESELVFAVMARSPRRRPSVLVVHERPLVGEGVARVAERRAGADVRVVTDVHLARDLLETRRFGAVVCSDTLVDEFRAVDPGAPRGPVLVLARAESRRGVALAAASGAAGVVSVDAGEGRLGAAVAAVLDGGTVFPAALPKGDGPTLTPREQEVLDGFDLGLSDKEIAVKLGVSVSTVKTHARSVYTKLGVTSRTGALHKARTIGLL